MSEDHFTALITIIESAIEVLSQSSDAIRDSLRTGRRTEKEFENHVLLALKGASQNTGFEFSFLESSHAFPDILAEHVDDVFFGVEVKTASGWSTNGNSINAGITDDRIQRIVIIYCKTEEPIEFDFKPYEDAIRGISVTHSPRYVLNMRRSSPGILQQMGLSYNEFRVLTMQEKVRLIRKWYIDNDRDDGKWWI